MNSDYRPAPHLLADRVILITGAGSGLGRAASLTYANLGATVILLGKTVKKLEKVFDEIVAVGGPEPAIFPMDLAGATVDDYRDMAERIDKSLGRLDGLLLNAGVLGALCPLEHYEHAVWQNVMQVNLTSPVFMTQACLPLLKRAPDASVIFTTSNVGRVGKAYWGAYAASKFATEGVVQILTAELASTHVRVNCLNPGRVATRMRAEAYPGEDPGTLPMPEEMTGAYVYLMGADSAGHRGQSLDAWRTV